MIKNLYKPVNKIDLITSQINLSFIIFLKFFSTKISFSTKPTDKIEKKTKFRSHSINLI